jgi:hypothetical protein
VSKAAVGFVAGLTTLAWVAVVSAASPVDLFNAGARTESVQAFDVHVQDLKRGTLYGASTFPLKLTARPPDALWLGGQTRAGKFRFVVSGKTVVIYEQPPSEHQEETFPAFIGASNRLLATMVLGAKT